MALEVQEVRRAGGGIRSLRVRDSLTSRMIECQDAGYL